MATSSALAEPPEACEHRLRLIAGLTFEVIPLKSLDEAIAVLPAASKVSVTVSPIKGQAATCEITERLLQAGHQPIPHIAARLMPDRRRVAELAAWIRSTGLTTIFLVGGDAESPQAYRDAAGLLRDLLECDHGLSTIGITGYPHGHPLIDKRALHEALHVKQSLLTEAGIAGYCSTQMCFDAERISRWLHNEREAGLTLPVHLGIAGVVDRTKLLTVGARLGIGSSLRYLRKNFTAATKLLSSSSYNPDQLLTALSPRMAALGIEGLHVFTFNQVTATAAWQSQHNNLQVSTSEVDY